MTKSLKILSWLCSIIASLIMLQTLYFKFTAAPESVYIFTKLGMEPYGRIGIGIAEFLTSVLIMLPKTRLLGALMAIGIMLGAVFFHLTSLGINVMNDGGYLFILGIIVILCSIICLYLEKDKLLQILKRVFKIKPKYS